MRTNASVVSKIAAVVLAAGCGGQQQAPTTPSPVTPASLSISGRVTAAATGGALVGALVKVNGRTWQSPGIQTSPVVTPSS